MNNLVKFNASVCPWQRPRNLAASWPAPSSDEDRESAVSGGWPLLGRFEKIIFCISKDYFRPMSIVASWALESLKH